MMLTYCLMAPGAGSKKTASKSKSPLHSRFRPVCVVHPPSGILYGGTGSIDIPADCSADRQAKWGQTGQLCDGWSLLGSAEQMQGDMVVPYTTAAAVCADPASKRIRAISTALPGSEWRKVLRIDRTVKLCSKRTLPIR